MSDSSILKRLELETFPQPDIIQLKYPVFFCHGFGTTGTLVQPSPLNDPCMQFRKHGIIAFSPNIVPFASIETRAENWVKLINIVSDKYGFQKFNVIAHSMGGLDMRYALANKLDGGKIASLTTVATPHHGSYLADFVLKTPGKIAEKLADLVDWFGDGVYPEVKSEAMAAVEQLTTDYVQNVFNPNTPDTDTPIFSYSAAVGKGTDYSLNAIFRLQNSIIFDKEGANDSFVSEQSARWGKHLGTIHLSHANQINIQVSKDYKPVYRKFWINAALNLQKEGF